MPKRTIGEENELVRNAIPVLPEYDDDDNDQEITKKWTLRQHAMFMLLYESTE